MIAKRFAELLGVAIFKGTFEPIIQLCFAYIKVTQHFINGKGSFYVCLDRHPNLTTRTTNTTSLPR